MYCLLTYVSEISNFKSPFSYINYKTSRTIKPITNVSNIVKKSDAREESSLKREGVVFL